MARTNQWTTNNSAIIRACSRWKALAWKALLMRKRSIIITILEILIPVIFSLQIRLIFEPLALNLQHRDHHDRDEILASFPKEIECSYAPKSEFHDQLMEKVSALLDTPMTPAASEKDLVTLFYAKNNTKRPDNVMWVIFKSSGDSKPDILDYDIRSQQDDDNPPGTDSYISSGFMAMQLAVEYSFVELWKTKDSPITGENLGIGQFPHYQIDFPIMPSTVRPNIGLIYYMTVVGFLLIPLAALDKAIQDKESGFKALMRMLGINSTFLYLGWVDYLMITAIPASIFCTLILGPVYSVSALVLFVFMLMFITMSAFFVFALGTFFSHSIKAILACFLLWIFMAHLTITLDESLIDAGLFLKTMSLFLPHSGLLYGLAAFTSKSDVEEEIETIKSRFWKDGAEELVKDQNKISIELVLIAWTCHIIGWYYVAVYLDNVYPGKFGTKKPFYYPFKGKSKPSDINVTFRGSTNWSAVERPPTFVEPKIRVRKITMTFGLAERLEVLRDMSIDFYPNEFNIILGHNGAGKSTLLKIMTGMYQTTQGRIYIEGRDYNDPKRPEKRNPKTIVSYCPQENVLVNYLSTMEHLYLFGMIKGMSLKEARKAALILLNQFQLEDEKNFTVKKLTFGAKRRLCLAVALMGPSEVLILDEPTYGVDPQHRKLLWEILATMKRKKTVIMATNSMEAADTLADRITIIANNRVECCGSKSYLNRRYGIGYELSMVMKPGYDLQRLRESLQELSSEVVSLVGKMGLMLRFNVSTNTGFPNLLNFLEANKEDLKITSIALNPASIEGQFRKIGLISQFRERGVVLPHDEYEWVFQERRRHLIQGRANWNRISDDTLYLQQALAMLYRKGLHVAASWNPYLFSIIFSIIALILTMTVSGLSKFPHIHSPEVELNAAKYASRNFFMLLHADEDPECQNFYSALKSSSEGNGLNSFHMTRNVTASSIMSHPESHSIEFRDRYFMAIDILSNNQIEIMYSPLLIHSGPVSLNQFHNALLKYQTDNDGLQIKLKSRPILDPDHWQYRIVHGKGVRNWENAAIVTTLFLLLPSMDLGARETRSLYKLLQFNTNNVSTVLYWFPSYCIDILIYLISMLITSLATFGAYYDRITLTGVIIGEALLIIFCYGLVAIAMGYCIQLCVHQTGTLYFIIMILNLFTILVINPEILFPVVMRHISTRAQQIMEILLHIFPPYVFACAIGNFIGINLYNIECAIVNECENEFAMEDPCCRNCGEDYCYKPIDVLLETNMDSFGFHAIAIDIFLLVSQTVGFHLLLVFFESKSLRKWRTLRLRKAAISPKGKDTKAEAKSIDALIKNHEGKKSFPSNAAVVVKNLSKTYGKKQVLRDVNLKINTHDCFGLLGMNGAGKSTFFRTLTGGTHADSGKTLIHGLDYAGNVDEFLGMIGYCPQSNGVVDFLTGRQSLCFFAALRGIPRENIRDEVDRWLDVFDLLEFENLKLGTCSLGVRKKIAVLQSLIGNLPVIFLDEPSSGMDVIGRSSLGETLHQMQELGASILLSTHYLEEAEALCNRVGILVDGELVKIGSCESLIEQRGDRFVMTLILNPQASPEAVYDIKVAIAEALPSAKFIDGYLDMLTYEFVNTISYSYVYDQLEALKLKYPALTDYFVNQQSLEHIYHQLTKREPKGRMERISLLQRFFEHFLRV